jgi:acyl-coenzyme A synthetase/AMP-(fatty) acid ligase
VFVEGRAEGALNLAGMRIQPENIEQVLAEKLGLLECAVFTLPQANGDDHLAVAITPGEAAKTSAIEALLPSLLGPAQGVRIRVVTVATIPRAGMGKIARRQLKLLFSTQT